MENNFVFGTWFDGVGISDPDEKSTVKNWLNKESLNTYAALKTFKPHTQCPTENFRIGWKNALEYALGEAFPNGKAFSL
jgi:hypothetical protein